MEFVQRQPIKNRRACCVYGCKSTANKNRTIRFHKFPNEGDILVPVKNHFGQEIMCDRLYAWQLALNIKKGEQKTVVCSLHFQSGDYKSNARNKLKQYLKPTAVPSCNLPSSRRGTSEESSHLKKRQQRTNAKQQKPTKGALKNNILETNVTTDPLEIYIKEEPLDPLHIKDEIENIAEPEYELIQNYTNEYFLVPLSELNEQLPPESIKEDDIREANIETIAKKASGGRKRKIYCPIQNKEYEEFLQKQVNGINKKDQVECKEKFHIVDIFTIFGKSVADQLRSFPTDKAVTLQNKIQDLITEENAKIFNKS